MTKLEPGSLLVLVCAPPLVRRAVPGQVDPRTYFGWSWYILGQSYKPQASSAKQQAWQWSRDIIGF